MSPNKRRYLVTGGTSGIGFAIAHALLVRGDQVYCVGKGADHLRAAEKSFARFDSAMCLALDLTGEDAVRSLIETIRAEGAYLDGLINCAGTIGQGGIESETSSDWARVLKTNLDTAFLASKHALPLLKSGRSPSIVSISSVCALRPCTSLSYSVSKAGLDMLTKCLARDLAKHGIRVNSVNPGVVETNLQKGAGLFQDEASYHEWVGAMTRQHPLGRIGAPNDIASAVLFLMSEEAGWITGAIISVDGGRAVA